jgi:hypothetical protein
MGKPVVHWELMSRDPAKVADFYQKIFDWKIQYRPELNYRIVETGSKDGINGGIVKPQRPEPWPGNMTMYIAVDDLAPYRKRIKKPAERFTWKSRKSRVWDGSPCSPTPRAE